MQAAEADRLQAEAQLAAAQSTFERLKKAAETPGAVAGNELVQAEKQVEAARRWSIRASRRAVLPQAAVRRAEGSASLSEITRPSMAW